jgi:hypothetical protein
VTGLSYYVMTWSIKKKGPVFTAAFNPLLVVFSFLLQTFLLGNSAHLGRYVCTFSIPLYMTQNYIQIIRARMGFPY